jgi:chorismate mutase/prephenate dehydratase
MESTFEPLQQLRIEIDSIDQRLVKLLNHRAALLVSWLLKAQHQTAAALTLQDCNAKILAEVLSANPGPIPDSALQGIYREIIDGAFELARSTRVGYLGPEGTFSHQAALLYFGDAVDYENLRTLEGVFEEVSRGHVDYGLVPIENSTGGAIIESLDSFLGYLGRLTIWGEICLNIHFSLFSKAPVDRIRKIYSKPEALAQCHRWLSNHFPNAERIPYDSTAAAIELAYLADPSDGLAAVGSQVAASRYGLQPLFEKIETRQDNVTRFLILSRKSPAPSPEDKTSLIFTCADRPGSLVDILNVFKRNQINLSHIEKRPSREFGSDYTFFVDLQGNAQSSSLAEVLGEARAHCKTLVVLGSYPVYCPDQRFQEAGKLQPMESLARIESDSQGVDQQLVSAINHRAELAIRVGEFKRKSETPIYAPHRESAVLQKIRKLNQGPLPDRSLERIYRELMSGSFRLEKPLRIAYIGPVGGFDHLAAFRHFGSSVEFAGVRESRDVFQGVAAAEVDYGLVPIENSSSGGVNETLDAFIEFHHQLNIYGEVRLEIHYGMLADCKPEEVKKIYATSKLFQACRNWLSTQYPHAVRVVTETSQQAMEAVREELDRNPLAGAAAIGSALAGQQLGIRLLFEAIEDRQGNITRYLILSRSRTEISGSDKSSLMFTTHDQAGALVDVLDCFKRNSINLTHLEKRPSGQTRWDYTFFVELEGHRADPTIAAVIGEARAHCKELTILGSFPASRLVL